MYGFLVNSPRLRVGVSHEINVPSLRRAIGLILVHSEEVGKREELVSSSMGDLEQVFKSFCAFGGGKGDAPLMDNAKFAKFFRDLKLLDKSFTATDVDIIFSKCKE